MNSAAVIGRQLRQQNTGRGGGQPPGKGRPRALSHQPLPQQNQLQGKGGKDEEKEKVGCIQNIRNKVTIQCLWLTCKALSGGMILLIIGTTMSVVGFYADTLSTEFVEADNSTTEITNQDRHYHLHNLTYVGPVFMGLGGFVIVAAFVMTFDGHDSGAKVVPMKDDRATADGSLLTSLLVDDHLSRDKQNGPSTSGPYLCVPQTYEVPTELRRPSVTLASHGNKGGGTGVTKNLVKENAIKNSIKENAVKNTVKENAVKNTVKENAVKNTVKENAVKNTVKENAVKNTVKENAVKNSIAATGVKKKEPLHVSHVGIPNGPHKDVKPPLNLPLAKWNPPTLPHTDFRLKNRERMMMQLCLGDFVPSPQDIEIIDPDGCDTPLRSSRTSSSMDMEVYVSNCPITVRVQIEPRHLASMESDGLSDSDISDPGEIARISRRDFDFPEQEMPLLGRCSPAFSSPEPRRSEAGLQLFKRDSNRRFPLLRQGALDGGRGLDGGQVEATLT